MATQFSVTLRNNRGNQIESTIGASAVLRIYTGSPPADCATAASGTLLVSMSLPSDWMAAFASGTASKVGSWSASASGTGTAGYYRIWDSGVTTCHVQGTVTATGGGGDMTVDNTSIASGQTVTVNTYSITEANA